MVLEGTLKLHAQHLEEISWCYCIHLKIEPYSSTSPCPLENRCQKNATFRLVVRRTEVGNSLDTVYGDVVDDGVGDAVLKLSNIREIV